MSWNDPETTSLTVSFQGLHSQTLGHSLGTSKMVEGKPCRGLSTWGAGFCIGLSALDELVSAKKVVGSLGHSSLRLFCFLAELLGYVVKQG